MGDFVLKLLPAGRIGKGDPIICIAIVACGRGSRLIDARPIQLGNRLSTRFKIEQFDRDRRAIQIEFTSGDAEWLFAPVVDDKLAVDQ